MPLNPDDTVCYCFHVSLRKIETFCRVEKPRHPAKISECLSAGSGCGWCVPTLEQIHQRICGNQDEAQKAPPQELPDAETYQAGREKYFAKKNWIPPTDAKE